MSYALACALPDTMRAIGMLAGGSMSGCDGSHRGPVPIFIAHGTSDPTCRWPGSGWTQLQDLAERNGCDPMDIPTLVNQNPPVDQMMCIQSVLNTRTAMKDIPAEHVSIRVTAPGRRELWDHGVKTTPGPTILHGVISNVSTEIRPPAGIGYSGRDNRCVRLSWDSVSKFHKHQPLTI